MRIKLRGSYIVEASILFPIVVLLIAFILNTAIALYGAVDEAAADTEQLRKMDAVEMFWDAVQIEQGKDVFQSVSESMREQKGEIQGEN